MEPKTVIFEETEDNSNPLRASRWVERGIGPNVAYLVPDGGTEEKPCVDGPGGQGIVFIDPGHWVVEMRNGDHVVMKEAEFMAAYGDVL